MLFTSNNTTNATENTAEETQGAGKMGILKNIAVIAGTAAGIGGILFGAKKLHDHFSQDYLDDFDDFFEDEDNDPDGTTGTTNEEPSETFNEVEDEEPVDEATSEEESKEEETINETPVEEETKTEVTESETTVRLKEIKTVFETFKLDLSKDDGMSVLKKLEKIDEDSMIDLHYITRDKNLTESERKLGDEILGNFLKEITKVIEKSERILNGSQVTTGTAKTLYEFLNTLRWSINSVATREVKDRIIAARDLALQISEGETKTSDTSSDETQVEDVKVSGETQTGTREVIPAYKDRTNKQDLRMSLVMDKLGELADRLDEFTTKGFDISTNHMVEIIESFDQEIDKTAGITWTTAEEKQVKAYELRLHAAVNLMYDKFVEEIASSESINTSLEIKAADFEVVRAAYTEMKHVRVPKGFNVHVSTVTRAFEDLRKRSKKSAGETKTAENPLSYTMTEKVAEAVKTGAEIQAPVAATEGSSETRIDPETQATLDDTKEIHRIIGAIDNRTEPWKNDMKFFVRCLGGSASRVKVELLSENQAEDLENSVIVLMKMLEMCFEHEDASTDKVESLIAAEARCQNLFNEFVASGLVDLVGPRYHDSKLKSLSKVYADALSRLQTKRISLTETAATQEPEEPAGLPVDITSEMNELTAKLKEAGDLMKAERWSDAKEFYKSQLTPYLADENLSAELREQISAISTKATNMLAGQKQLERKKEAEAKKSGYRKSGKKARRSKR